MRICFTVELGLFSCAFLLLYNQLLLLLSNILVPYLKSAWAEALSVDTGLPDILLYIVLHSVPTSTLIRGGVHILNLSTGTSFVAHFKVYACICLCAWS